jgi:hypothetical protein
MATRKGEAQLFLDRLFRGFGHEGVPEAGATLEMHVKQGSSSNHRDVISSVVGHHRECGCLAPDGEGWVPSVYGLNAK